MNFYLRRTSPAPGPTSTARRGLRVLVAAALGASMVAAGTPALAAAKVATHISALATPTTAKVSSIVVVTGTAKPAISGLAVSLQRFDGRHWNTVAHAKESRTGAYSVSMKAPGKAATMRLRVVRAAAKSDKAGVSRTLVVRVVKTAYVIKAVHGVSVPNGQPITVTGTVKPKGTGTVQLQRKLAGKWRTIATAKLTKTSTYTVRTVQNAGSYALRMVKPQTTTIAGGVSKGFTVTVAAPIVAPPVIAAPVISTTSLPAGITHHPYSATLAASGGSGALSWTAATGTLPAGLSLSTAGVISGTPAAAGVGHVTVTVTDAGARTASVTLTLTVTLATGTLSAWGYNGQAQLGDGIRPDRDLPVQVAGLAGVTKIAAGYRTGYALVGGGVVAYGVGFHGELGNGGTAFSAAPVQVSGLTTGVLAISAGSGSGYALASDHTVWAWGVGTDGQLGNGAYQDSLVPVQVSGLTNVSAIAGGEAAGYALRTDGTVWAWGQNFQGELGDGTTTGSAVPVQVTGLSGQPVTAIAAGGPNGYALMTDHTVRAWGYNGYGQVGDGTTTDRTAAVAVSGLTTATAIAAGSGSAYARTTGGTEVAWGYNGDGELGNNDFTDSSVPVVVSGLTTVSGIAASAYGAYAVLADGTVRSWGDNFSGQLGNGTTVSSALPVTVTGLGAVAAVAGGWDDGYALKTDGTVWSWGADLSALLDHGSATPVVGLTGVTSAAADYSGGVAVKSDGTVWDWGTNYS
ncbi:MAG: hypothetical protein QOF39_2430, partial [Frankiales bacterium]|nr:hypothetical protein [Frankiales bacterium]